MKTLKYIVLLFGMCSASMAATAPTAPLLGVNTNPSTYTGMTTYTLVDNANVPASLNVQNINIGSLNPTITMANGLYGSSGNGLNVSSQPVCEVFSANTGTIISSITVQVTTAGGSVDVGIYNTSGTLLASNGGTAEAAIGRASLPMTAPVTLASGTYWACLVANNTTIAFESLTWSNNVPPGQQTCAQSANDYPLPTSLPFPCSGSRLVNYDIWVNPMNGTF